MKSITKSAVKCSAIVLAIGLAVVALVAIGSSNVYADSYTEPPEDLQFNKTYNISGSGWWARRFDFHVSKGGALKLKYNATSDDWATDYIEIYNDADDRQSYFPVEVNEYYPTETVYLRSGDYYIVAESVLINDYSELTFKATFGNAKGTSIRKLKRSSGRRITASIKKLTIANSLQMQVSRDRKFRRGVKKYSQEQWSDNYITTWRTGRLKKGKYYVRIRACYNATDGGNVYSRWSKVKSIRVR